MQAETKPADTPTSESAATKRFARCVEDIQPNQFDSTGVSIVKVYARRVPKYAVYRTADRASIQYANDEGLSDTQRKSMAPLNVLRAQIDGLVDGWRKSRVDKAKEYDARVAAALILCLEDDVNSAQASLTDIKNDILAERNSWGRLQYLLSASLVALAIAVVLALAWAASVDFRCQALPNAATNYPLLFTLGASLGYIALGAVMGFVGGALGFAIIFETMKPESWGWIQRRGLIVASIATGVIVMLLGSGAWVVASCPSAHEVSTAALSLGTSIWIGGIGGVGGAFFSIALGTMQRTVATSLNSRDNFADATLRVIVGLIGAWVLVLLLRAKLLPDFTIASKSVTGENATVEITLLIGFVAGFLERLVPDLLERKAEDKTKQAEEKVKQAEDRAKKAEAALKEGQETVVVAAKDVRDKAAAKDTDGKGINGDDTAAAAQKGPPAGG